MPEFCDMLKYLRKRANLTQQELADNTGLTRSRINNYEQGVRQPDFETAELFADYFNIDLDTLLARNESLSVSSNPLIPFEVPSENSSESIFSSLSQLSDNQLDDLFVQMISGRDKDYLLRLASKILEIASNK